MCKVLVLSGASHLKLCDILNKDWILEHETGFFKNGEVSFRLKTSVRNEDIVVLQSFDLPNSRLMELLLAVDACKRAGARYVTVILPYFPYSRMDKKHRAGQPISAKVICDLLSSVNVDRIVTFDLHAEQIQGFTNNRIVFDHLSMLPYITAYFRQYYETSKINWLYCAPDAGSVKRVKFFASLNDSSDICIISKSRVTDGVVDDMVVLGDVTNRFVVIVDDMIDTGGTIQKAAVTLRAKGASGVVVVATHGIFSPPARDVLHSQAIWVTDTLPPHKDIPNMVYVVPTRYYIRALIDKIFNHGLLGEFFEVWSGNLEEITKPVPTQ